MRFPGFTHSSRHRRRVLLPRLVWAVLPLGAIGCEGATESLAPTAESESLTDAAAEAATAVPAGLVVGDKIAFVSRRAGRYDLYRMDPQGGSVLPLTSSPTVDEMTPAWSWDNQRIAMVRQRPYGGSTVEDIYMVNRDGGNGHWVRPTAYPFNLRDPAWSPDGSRLVLTVFLNEGTYLATMNTTTGDVSLIGGGAGGIRGWHPSYDASGQRIVYSNYDTKSIIQINADGTGKKVLASSTQSFAFPALSPDGKKLAFSRYAAGTLNGGTIYTPDIFVKNLVTGTTKRIVASTSYDEEPTWSPDGTRIAFVSRRTGMSQIYTVSASGGGLARITQTNVPEEGPAWTH